MIAWDKISDEEMRSDVVRGLESSRDDWARRAEHHEREAAAWSNYCQGVAPALSFAARCRRQAAHYQQAIDLLSGAAMPEKEGP